MVALRVTASLPSVAFAISLVRCRPAQRPPRAAFVRFSSGGGSSGQASPLQRQLVLYTKPGCCLCEGLKEKLQAALSLGGSHSLHSVQLQVRDISGNAEWERLYQYEIPVLAKVLPDGREEILPRLSPSPWSRAHTKENCFRIRTIDSFCRRHCFNL